jgi:hypothetical protein
VRDLAFSDQMDAVAKKGKIAHRRSDRVDSLPLCDLDHHDPVVSKPAGSLPS